EQRQPNGADRNGAPQKNDRSQGGDRRGRGHWRRAGGRSLEGYRPNHYHTRPTDGLCAAGGLAGQGRAGGSNGKGRFRRWRTTRRPRCQYGHHRGQRPGVPERGQPFFGQRKRQRKTETSQATTV
ncbi:uncharacterized protein METZ01_LOCUS407014, partial [marine metagenome]